ncbi:calcipressin-1a isoform X1 [Brachyhypopomus gauderio]|uniref:calcipressin-1a isoform X1 n=1 Tax=Brachyhypopomus gauderio TaxID=698409 RepID=UPI004041BA63
MLAVYCITQFQSEVLELNELAGSTTSAVLQPNSIINTSVASQRANSYTFDKLTPPMQQVAPGHRDDTVDVRFTELPSSLVACKVAEEMFADVPLKARFEELFRAFDSEATFQFFKSFRRVRINFTNALAAAEARAKLHKTDFSGREVRLYFAQSVHIGSPRLEPPKPDKQFLLSPPPSPPVGWEQAQDATPVINYDLLCAITRLGPGEKYELHSGTPTTPSVVVHVCESDQDSSGAEDDLDGFRRPRPRIVQTRRPDYVPGITQ